MKDRNFKYVVHNSVTEIWIRQSNRPKNINMITVPKFRKPNPIIPCGDIIEKIDQKMFNSFIDDPESTSSGITHIWHKAMFKEQNHKTL